MDSQVDVSLQNQDLRTPRRTCDVGLAMGGQTVRKSARKFTQVAKSRKFHAYTVNLRRLALGGQTVKNVRRLAREFELDASPRKTRWPNETQVDVNIKCWGLTACEAHSSAKLSGVWGTSRARKELRLNHTYPTGTRTGFCQISLKIAQVLSR